jgi:hypothetical protein
VKHRPDPIERNPNSGSTTLPKLGSQSNQKGFNISPIDRSGDRVLEDLGESASVTAIQLGL